MESTLTQVIQRALNDPVFRAQLKSDAAKTLAGLGLAPAELAALASGDPKRLTALGVDQRLSKALSVGGIAPLFMSIPPDLAVSGSTFTDEAAYDARSAIAGDPAAPASLVQPGEDVSKLHMRMVEQDLNVANSAVLGAIAEPVGGDMVKFNLRRIEGDLDVTADTKSDYPEPDANSTLTEY